MLEIRDLHAGYASHAVLRGVDLRVERGELLAVIGPNGCGKTTLLRVISGVHAPDDGDVLLDGAPLASMSASALARRVAVVAQGGALPERFSSFEVVLMGRTPHLRWLQSEGARDIDVVREAMERAGCWHLRERYTEELSGGERQRVVIARALAQEPELMLLDEPTSHLDMAHQVATFRLMRELCREQRLAVVAVVHDLTLAAMFADRIALLSEGRILADGAPDDVLRAPAIAQAYGVAVRVLQHPTTGRPIVVPDMGDEGAAPVVAAAVVATVAAKESA